ncbi:MAG TPA: metalloregulator ArsR/SmtB family transcription factor [Anaeromyxobacteraceae bacterium]|nr:metalloregulator ArsR/SmtB family transcription factor [Anaeromyxobacteraceae bacterium]
MTSPARRFRDASYDQLARVPKALASPHRLELLQVLAQAPRTVEALSVLVEMSLANTSQHLKVLRAAGLIEASKEGLFVRYRIADPSVLVLLRAVLATAEARLGDFAKVTREFLAENAQLESIDDEELLRKIRRGDATLIDVRPPEEYAAAHLRGALSVPLEELGACLTRLPKRHQIVALCRGPYCALGIQAVRQLRAAGFKAERLPHGMPEWEALGLSVERSAA